MREGAEIRVKTKPYVRLLAIGLACLFAVSMACGVGAAALADDFEDLDSSVPESAVVAVARASEQTVRVAQPGGKQVAAESRDRFVPLIAASSSVGRVTAEGQQAFALFNGGIPRTRDPTGPPSVYV